jgi:glucans biosynthesis protein
MRPRAADAQAPAPSALIAAALGDGQRFAPSAVIDIARGLSRRPFVPAPNDLPDPFNGLNYEQYVAIKSLPANRLWDGEGRGFTAVPLPRGFVFTAPVGLFSVEDGVVRRIGFDRSRFDFGGLNVPPTLPDLGFSGFRLASMAGNTPFDFAIVQGATFFRALARGQNFGTVSRALTLKPGEARGEEFPIFRAFWLERPTPAPTRSSCTA